MPCLLAACPEAVLNQKLTDSGSPKARPSESPSAMELLNLEVAIQSLGPLLAGLAVTIELTFIIITLSLILAMFVALGGMSRFATVRWPLTAYIELVRNTPALLQIVYIYFVLPEIGIRLEAFTAIIIAFTLNYSAYLSEVYRAGIQAIGTGQHDAAAALGMTRTLAMRRIILPQAIRIVIPTLGNYFISLFKDTALASAVGIQELLYTSQIISARNYQYFTLYTMAGFLYFAVCFPAARLVDYLERVTRRGYRWRSR
jgi:His/Glu/Gln/Arg/opine family amino acid ABC transporter permease subunit